MDKLVYKDGDFTQIKDYENKMCYELCEEFNSNCDQCVMTKVLELVADYQDTKLMPKQVNKLKTKYKELQKENRKLKKEMLKMSTYAWYGKDDENVE